LALSVLAFVGRRRLGRDSRVDGLCRRRGDLLRPSAPCRGFSARHGLNMRTSVSCGARAPGCRRACRRSWVTFFILVNMKKRPCLSAAVRRPKKRLRLKAPVAIGHGDRGLIPHRGVDLGEGRRSGELLSKGMGEDAGDRKIVQRRPITAPMLLSDAAISSSGW
jgi:hypothetical protein